MSQICNSLTQWGPQPPPIAEPPVLESSSKESTYLEMEPVSDSLRTNKSEETTTSVVPNLPGTMTTERSSPECDLNYEVTWLDSHQSTQTTVTEAIGMAMTETERRSLLLDGGEPSSDELRRKLRNNKRFANGRISKFNSILQLSSINERRLNRGGTCTPLSTANVAVVPDILQRRWKQRGDDAVLAVISALYAKIIIVMGLAFPMTEVISNHVTSSSYQGFYLYLYFGSILYFLYVFFTLVRNKAAKGKGILRCFTKGLPEEGESEGYFNEELMRPRAFSDSFRTPTHHGSFYLRIGAVAFGVGSMIYSGLEFAQYFEVDASSDCHNILMAVTPATRMVFTFIQMYFIFLNSKMAVCEHKAIAYFGLMHMIATNLCVWLNVIIEETKHEIIHFVQVHQNNGTEKEHHTDAHHQHHQAAASEPLHQLTLTLASQAETIIAQALVDPVADLHDLHDSNVIISGTLQDECRRSEVMGNLVQDASPFLFPCAIEYSLICAAILYVMWKNAVAVGGQVDYNRQGSSSSSAAARRSRHHYTVDCAKANKGLFAGIFVLVLTIISLIMFFALINHPDYMAMAVMEVSVARFVLFLMSFLAVVIGIFQVRELRFDASRRFDLDDVLLIFGQIGLISYNIFTVIAAYFQMEHDEDSTLVLMSALAALLQAVTQTLFLLDATRRNTYSADQQRRKPGREVVTFLLVANFAMWTVNTLEKSRADVNPVQLQFYGLWPWIIITNVSMPLAIFYRFHSTVVLCEIWKRCYKAKPEYG